MFNPTESRFTELKEMMDYVSDGLKRSRTAREQALKSGLRSQTLHAEDVTHAYHAALERLTVMIVLLAQELESEASDEFSKRLQVLKATNPSIPESQLERENQ